uniref:Integrase catalytic domain-containing protein n=1 Tax=Oryza brachyantha TaxID=4533 RepID=J3N7J8_ORYBR
MGEPLLLYIAVTPHVISAALVVEHGGTFSTPAVSTNPTLEAERPRSELAKEALGPSNGLRPHRGLRGTSPPCPVASDASSPQRGHEAPESLSSPMATDPVRNCPRSMEARDGPDPTLVEEQPRLESAGKALGSSGHLRPPQSLKGTSPPCPVDSVAPSARRGHEAPGRPSGPKAPDPMEACPRSMEASNGPEPEPPEHCAPDALAHALPKGQRPIYFISEALMDAKIHCPQAQKTVICSTCGFKKTAPLLPSTLGNGGRERVARISKRYVLVQGTLYHRDANGILMKCIPRANGLELLAEIHEDILGPFRPARGGNKYLYVAIDKFTKWPKAYPIWEIDRHLAIRFIKRITARFGVPNRIIMNNGTQFISELFGDYCDDMGIKLCFASPAHPKSNNQVERVNAEILKGLKTKMYNVLKKHDDSYTEELKAVLWANRNAPSHATGETPFFMVYGAGAILPPEGEPWNTHNLTKINYDAMTSSTSRKEGGVQCYAQPYTNKTCVATISAICSASITSVTHKIEQIIPHVGGTFQGDRDTPTRSGQAGHERRYAAAKPEKHNAPAQVLPISRNGVMYSGLRQTHGPSRAPWVGQGLP